MWFLRYVYGQTDRQTDDREIHYKTSNPGSFGLLAKKRVNTDRQTDRQTNRME